jgi:hypothetical protein
MALQSASDLEVIAVSAPGKGAEYFEWRPTIAGAVAAAAISFLLLTFGGAIGLSLTSPWPYAGASALAIGVALAWWTVMVQIGSFAAGGYLAGRLRSRWGESASEEGRFRDGAHGFMVWAVGVLVGATVLGLTAGSALQTITQSAAIGGAAAVASADDNPDNSPLAYAVDFLLRPAAAPAAPASSTGSASLAPAPAQQSADGAMDLRSETSRIFAAAVENRELTAADRDYLAQLVAARTGLPEAEAQKRVDASIAELQRLEIAAREQIDKARKAAIIAGFIAAASLLAACAAACAGATLGGRHRDEGNAPMFFGKRFW